MFGDSRKREKIRPKVGLLKKCMKMVVLTVRQVCCGVICEGIFRSGGVIDKMDGLCACVEM